MQGPLTASDPAIHGWLRGPGFPLSTRRAKPSQVGRGPSPSQSPSNVWKPCSIASCGQVPMRADRQSAGPSSITPGLSLHTVRTSYSTVQCIPSPRYVPAPSLSARDVARNHSSQDRASGAPMSSPHRCHAKRKRKTSHFFHLLAWEGDARRPSSAETTDEADTETRP